MQAIDQVADVVHDIAHMQIFTPAVTGIKNLLEILTGRDDRLVVGQRAVAKRVDRGDVLIGLHNPTRELRQLFLDANVSRHGS